MNSKVAHWSEEKQKNLQEQLQGFWSQDVWPVPRKANADNSDERHSYFRFTCHSQALNGELKYALWYKFDRKEWKFTRSHSLNCTSLKYIVGWLNQVGRTTMSLMEKSLDQWELSLRSYLVDRQLYRRTSRKLLLAKQEYVSYLEEDPCLTLFRQIYRIVEEAYDDRQETDKDRWNVRKMGLQGNLSRPRKTLNFSLITQPWLRSFAKAFIQYNLAPHSVNDCVQKLNALSIFSQFLAQRYPAMQLKNLDRSVIVSYISFLREQPISDSRRNRLLISLRVIFTTCAYQLHIEDITKEAIIFNEDFAKEAVFHPRELPEEVLFQIKKHLTSLPTILLRMIVINLSCGLRIGELCTLPLHCIFQDDQGRWYLQLYQEKGKKEHVLPLVDEVVVGTIQTQQEEIKQQWGTTCPFLFPSPRSPQKPYQQGTFALNINKWIITNQIRDRTEALFRFQSHQIRHTVAMGWLNDGVPLDVIRRLLNHATVKMTERYARRRDEDVRRELEKVHRTRKTVDYQGRQVAGDPRANDPEVQMTRKGMRGQTLAIGGCGRPVVLGDCSHANKCLTCPMWLTSTDDLVALKSFYERAVRLKQQAIEKGNDFVVQQQERIIETLAIRMKSLEETSMDSTLCVDDVLAQLHADLVEAESALEEAQENDLLHAAKYLERTLTDLRAKIAAWEKNR